MSKYVRTKTLQELVAESCCVEKHDGYYRLKNKDCDCWKISKEIEDKWLGKKRMSLVLLKGNLQSRFIKWIIDDADWCYEIE